MKYFVGIALFALLASGCHRIKGSGNIVTERRSVEAFTKVEAGAAFEVEVTQGSPLVEVEADDNLQQLIETRVSGDVLKIRFRKNYTIHDGHYLIRVSMPVIRSLESSGASSIRVMNAIRSEGKLSLSASGAGKITAELDAPEVDLEASGAGNLEVSGRTRYCHADASGGAAIKAGRLLSEKTNAEASGAGNVHVHASVKLDARASGAGNIHYRGGAAVESNTSGAGSVKRED